MEIRCAGELPGLNLNLRLPSRWEPFVPLQGDLTILPAAPVSGAYGLLFATMQDGITTEQSWLGPTAPYLKPGQPVKEPLMAKLPAVTPALFRAALKFERGGQSDQVTLETRIGKPPTK